MMSAPSATTSTTGPTADAEATPPQSEVKLSLEGLNKHYGSAHVVRDVSLDVASGEVVTLLGPSGSGKTTTMMMIAGFVSPDSGTVTLDGHAVNDVPPHKRNIGVVFQSYALFPHMSVLGNVEFPVRQRGVKRSVARRRAHEMLDLVGLDHLADRRVPQLSGGQQQRVALARALVFDPPLLIMDEPLSALDKRLREQMQEEIKRIQKAVGVTVLCVTHDQTEAFVLSDRVAVMNEGKILQIGPPQEVYESPADDFVAEFLGESNLLAGTVSSTDRGHMFVTDTGVELELAQPDLGSHKLLIRPERIQINDRNSGPGTSLNGRIKSANYLGNALTYHVDCDGLELLVRHPGDGSAPLAPGEPLSLRISPEACVPLKP